MINELEKFMLLKTDGILSNKMSVDPKNKKNMVFPWIWLQTEGKRGSNLTRHISNTLTRLILHRTYIILQLTHSDLTNKKILKWNTYI